MSKNPFPRYILAATALLAGLFSIFYYFRSMDAAEVIRKLSALRISLELYRLDKERLPANFADVTANGNLEETPPIKLSRHLKSSAVRETPAFRVTDSGSWAYVNDPKSPDFGLLFIDCAHSDEKGRGWSLF